MYNFLSRYMFIFIIIALLYLSNVFAIELSVGDNKGYQEIRSNMTKLETYIDNLNSEKIMSLLSKNAGNNIRKSIKKSFKDKTIDYFHSIESIKQVGKNKVKVITDFRLEGRSGSKSWNINSSNYFLFEKNDDKWKLLNTDFHKKLDFSAAFKIIGKIFKWIGIGFGGFVIVVLILVFWVWMLIDCINRSIKNKTLWILIIIFVPILGEVLYFFIPRRNYIKSQK